VKKVKTHKEKEKKKARAAAVLCSACRRTDGA